MTKSPGRTIKKDYSHISLRNPADLPSGPTEHLPGSVLAGLPEPHPIPGTPLPSA